MKATSGTLIALFLLSLCGGFGAGPAVRMDVIETWGWIIAHEKGVAGIEITDAELSVFLKGFEANAKGQPASFDVRKMFPDIERLAKERREKIMRALAEKNEAAAKVFFNELKKNTNIFELRDDVRYEILKPGSGAFPKPQQTVSLHYVAHLIDGTEFSEMGPIDMVLVTNRSICLGWTETLERINRGGKMRLYVPPPLAGEQAAGFGIAPGSAMIFEIELFDIKETSPEDLANSTLPPAPAGEPPASSGASVAQIMETWGWSIAQETGVVGFGLDDAQRTALMRGVSNGVKGEPARFDVQRIYPEVQTFASERRKQARLAAKQKRLEAMAVLFAELKKNTNVVELPDGLRYEIVKPGRGLFPRPGQIVLVDYTGRLIDGTVFDKTYNEPLNIEVGSVTPGWNEGIQKINQGGKIKLYIPPSIGYGDKDVSSVLSVVPSGSTLIYEIELLDIKDSLSQEVESGANK